MVTHTGGMVVIDVTNPKQPKEVGFYTGNAGLNGITIQGNYAYVAASDGLYIFDISVPKNPVKKSTIHTTDNAFEVEVSSDRAYVAGGGAICAVNVSQPGNPVLLGSAAVYLSEGSAIGSNNYVYATDFYGGLHMIDFSNPGAPVETNSFATLKEGFNMVVADSSLYIANGDKGMSVYDVSGLSSPDNPEKMFAFETNSKRGQARNVFVKDDSAYLASGRGGLIIFKIILDNPGIQIKATPRYYTAEGLNYLLECATGNLNLFGNAEWNFGDGTTGRGLNVSHVYKPGNYTAKVTVYNSDRTKFLQKEITIVSKFPDFSISASPLEGITALNVDFKCDLLSTNLTDSGLSFKWMLNQNVISESKSFSNTFVEAKTHTVKLEVRDPADKLVTEKSFNIKVNPPVILIIDGGRKIVSWGSIFVDKPAKYDADKDGINQAWEDAVMELANPQFELDEGEDWLKPENRYTHKVVNFVRISPYTSVTNRKYILFTYGITWSRDYGRYSQYLYAHNGDIEKVVMAWEVIDDKNLELRWVYTSAHNGEDTEHSGVWNAVGETTQYGKVMFWPDDTMKATLEFIFSSPNLSILKLYASEDKHAIYPTEECGESVKLVFVPYPFPWFVQEDVGSEGRDQHRFTCYNIGEDEEGARLMNDIGDIFPNERV